jgi:transposase
MRWIGVDLHKHYAHVVELSPDGSRSSRLAVHGELAAYCAELGPSDQLIVEASTNSFRFAEMAARTAGKVVVSEPAQTRGVVGKAAMNDKNAAAALAMLLRTGFEHPVWVPPAEVRALRCQVDHYRDLGKMRTQTINRVRSLFQQELTDYQPGATISAKAHSGLDEQFRDQPGHRLYLCSLLRQLNLFNAELAEIELSFGSWCRSSEAGLLLITVPGISPVLAAVLMAQIGDIERFPSADRLCSYAGLVPRVYQSGKVLRIGRITRSGPGIMRWALSIAIWNQRKFPTDLISFKQKLAQRRPKMVAHVAACRKLLAVIWSMLKHRRRFREEDADLSARKNGYLNSWPEPSGDSLVVPKIRNPRPSRRSGRLRPDACGGTDRIAERPS